MQTNILYRLGLCLFVFGICLFSYLDKRNDLTQKRMHLPALQKEVIALKEQIKKLQYEVEQFESPTHLMELARLPEYSHLKHPFVRDILTAPEAVARISSDETKVIKPYYRPKVTMAMGVKR